MIRDGKNEVSQTLHYLYTITKRELLSFLSFSFIPVDEKSSKLIKVIRYGKLDKTNYNDALFR